MPEAPPILFNWDGEAFHPSTQHNASKCDVHYVVGERYRLVEYHERSQRSHNHYFACIHSAWMNLPEDLADQYPTSEHLRKHALLKAGFRNERVYIADTEAEARRHAVYARTKDEFAVVTIKGCVVTEYTAPSQSRQDMGKAAFQASKEAVLDVLAGLLHVDRSELEKQAA